MRNKLLHRAEIRERMLAARNRADAWQEARHNTPRWKWRERQELRAKMEQARAIETALLHVLTGGRDAK